ncbi:MAG: YicC family protein [Lachnospiraceae bacterium]|nr:YicC family protein [Lachnospiraceae bacterium]
MIRSMTGFGRSELMAGSRKYTVEIKSVNHKYLDVTVKLPRKLTFLEIPIRNELKEYASRGKVDIFISMEDYAESTVSVKYNRQVAEEYVKYFHQMSQDFSLENDAGVSLLSRCPEVFSLEEAPVDEEELWQDLKRAFTAAAEQFAASRSLEGEHLKEDLLLKLDEMEKLVDFIEERSPKIIQEYQDRLREKVEAALADASVDENRLLTEVAIFADRSCVDEELVRLRSHIHTARESLQKGGNVGRSLDFIAQEMNREANTTLSKSSDLEITNHAILLKTGIEKIREQIQNLE